MLWYLIKAKLKIRAYQKRDHNSWLCEQNSKLDKVFLLSLGISWFNEIGTCPFFNTMSETQFDARRNI